MPTISRKMGMTIGVIATAVLVTSVGYYELAAPPAHYGFISMSKASSLLDVNYTIQINTTSPTPLAQNPFTGSYSYQAVGYSSPTFMNQGGILIIEEGYYNSTSAALGWYANHTNSVQKFPPLNIYNQSYKGFRVSYLNENLTSTPQGEYINVYAVSGHYVLEMWDGLGISITSSSEIPNLIHAQINAMA